MNNVIYSEENLHEDEPMNVQAQPQSPQKSPQTFSAPQTQPAMQQTYQPQQQVQPPIQPAQASIAPAVAPTVAPATKPVTKRTIKAPAGYKDIMIASDGMNFVMQVGQISSEVRSGNFSNSGGSYMSFMMTVITKKQDWKTKEIKEIPISHNVFVTNTVAIETSGKFLDIGSTIIVVGEMAYTKANDRRPAGTQINVSYGNAHHMIVNLPVSKILPPVAEETNVKAGLDEDIFDDVPF